MADSDKKSNAPLPWLLLTGILGVFAVGTPPGGSGSSTKKDEKKESVEDKPLRVSAREPLKPVFEFHRSHDNRTLSPVDELRGKIHGYETEFLIATVPDPIDSPYGHAFDQVVDAIQRGIEKKDGYILDRCWLPWELDRKAKPKPDEEYVPLRETQPGILLFRHGKDTKRGIDKPGLCVVFLIGETPMSGVHKQAFTKALRIMADVGHDDRKPVRVVGPYFSGSQTSMQFVFGDWWALGPTIYGLGSSWKNFRFDVISGNATAVRTSDFFGFESNRVNFPEWREDGLNFAATVIPTKTTLNAILHFLSRRDGSATSEPISDTMDRLPGKIALLTESNTGFGKAVSGMGYDQMLVLRFPLHISRIKNEYTQAFRKKDEQNGLKNDDPLAVSLNDDQASGEGIPSQGGSTTTAVNGQVLSRILATIAREQCKYVGVVASDTRDKLFLIRLIREYCPDVRVFVTEADLLLTHPDYRYHMRGVILGSTYPLAPRNQRWVKGDVTERILYPTVGSQGIYNAVLLQMGLKQHLLEYRPPAFALRDTARHDEADERPPVWVSMVAPNGTIVPLHLYTRYDDSSGYVTRVETVEDQTFCDCSAGLEYPGSLLPIGVALLTAWIILIVIAWANPHARLFWRGGSRITMPDLFYRNIILGSQVMLAVPLIAAAWSQGQANQFTSPLSMIVTTALCACGAGLAGAMLKPLCRTGIGNVFRGRPLPGDSGILRSTSAPSDKAENISWVVVNVLLLAAVFGFSFLFLSRFFHTSDYARRALYFVRASDLGTGLSPLTPLFLVCTAFAAWGFFQLKRSHIAERYHVPNPFPTDADFRNIHDSDHRIRGEIVHEAIAIKHAKSIAGAIIILGAFGVGIWLQALPTVEGWAWDMLFHAGFAGLFLLSCTTLIRLYFLWTNLRGLLEAIAARPMMRVFSALPSKVIDIFGKYLFTQRPKLEHLLIPAHQLRLTADAVKADPTAPEELRQLHVIAEHVEKTIHAHLTPDADKKAVYRAERDVREKLSIAASACLTFLNQRGRNLSVDEAFGGSEPPKNDSAPPWVRAAEIVSATQVIIYISQFFVQLRNLVWAAMVTSSLLLLAATSYPFHPEKLLLVGLIGLSGAGLAAVLYVLIEMNRDEIVSRVTKTTPGKFSLDSGFIGSFFTYIVPTVGVLAAQLSGSFRWILEPLLRVMK